MKCHFLLHPFTQRHFKTKTVKLSSSNRNDEGGNKGAKIYVRRSTTVHNLMFFAHTRLSMNCVTNTFLLVSSPGRSKQLLCFAHGQGQKEREQTHTTKNFKEFHDHSPLLTLEPPNVIKAIINVKIALFYTEKLISGFHIYDATKFKLQNHWSSWHFTFMMYKSSWKLIFIKIFAPNGFLVLW